MKTAARAKVALLVVLLSLSARAVFGSEAGENSSRGDTALRTFANETAVPASLRTFANDTAEPAAEPNASATGSKRMFIAPGFGAVLYKVRVDQEGVPNVSTAFSEEEYYTTALETRIFWGVNITRRAGLYTGVEAGGTIFLPRSETHTDTQVTVNDQERGYTTLPLTIVFNTSINGGSVFLLWKYGYRYEFVFQSSALSLGLQLGTGLSVFSGGYDVWVGDKDNPDSEVRWSTQSANLSLAAEFAFETAFRIGENFRLFAAAGLLVTPISFEDRDKTYFPGSEVLRDGSTTPNPDADYVPYALNAYRVEIEGFGFSMRAGASFNF